MDLGLVSAGEFVSEGHVFLVFTFAAIGYLVVLEHSQLNNKFGVVRES